MKGVSLLLVCLVALGGVSLLSLGVGRYPVSPPAILSWLVTGQSADANLPVVLLGIRLPRLVAAIAAGGALSLAGAAYQGLFRNPMVSPDILGVSSGSGFGAALGILFSLPVAAVQALSLAGGITAVLCAVLISRAIGRSNDSVLVLVLSGIVISSLFGALLSLLKYIADPLDKLPAITYWLMGSFADIRTGELGTAVAMVLAGAIPLLLVSWRLNVLSFAYSVSDVVLFGRSAHLGLFASPGSRDRRVAAECLDLLEIAHLAGRAFNELSGGERQMVILDEPTSNLDYGNQVRVLRKVRELAGCDIGILMATHHPDHAFMAASRVAVLSGGKLSHNGPPESTLTPETLRSLYGVEVQVFDTPQNGHASRRVCAPVVE
jgi:ABC-type enterochelin transport system permease subunit